MPKEEDHVHPNTGLQLENSEDDTEEENSDDFQKICEYQHKILRKYTMLGMISITDAPQFHTLVE